MTNMPMNEIIRQRRKELGLTQEKVAAALGVTAPAVNKWEKGTTWPDLSLIAPLARLLGVDPNTLFCFQKELTPQEVGLFVKEVLAAVKGSGFPAGFEMAMEKTREYPGCLVLFHTLALALDGSLCMSGLSAEERKPYEDRIIALMERVAEGEEEQPRDHAVFLLASKYIVREEYEKARDCLARLPDRPALDKKQLQANLLIQEGKLEEAGELLEHKFLFAANEIQGALYSLVSLTLKEGDGERADRLAEVSQQVVELFGMWDYGGFVGPFQAAVARRDGPGTLAVLRPMLEALLTPWEQEKSPLYHHISKKKGEGLPPNFGLQVLPSVLTELEDGQYDFLRGEPGFRELLRDYWAKCDKEKA